jgi:hypothetical protein
MQQKQWGVSDIAQATSCCNLCHLICALASDSQRKNVTQVGIKLCSELDPQVEKKKPYMKHPNEFKCKWPNTAEHMNWPHF